MTTPDVTPVRQEKETEAANTHKLTKLDNNTKESCCLVR